MDTLTVVCSGLGAIASTCVVGTYFVNIVDKISKANEAQNTAHIDVLSKSVDKLCAEMAQNRITFKEIAVQLAEARASNKSAHHRIDELKGVTKDVYTQVTNLRE